ncbi:cytoskeletal protein binding protein [Tulasnella sp. UAMH 9824]|nr:cytoskeletal protein binding protein [Tulasnella sp. UAMH 9824]
MEVPTARAAVSIPAEPSSASTQADNASAERAAAAAAKLTVDLMRTWSVSKIDRGSSRKKTGTLSIGRGSIFFACKTDKTPVQQWPLWAVLGASINMHTREQVDLDVLDPSKGLSLTFRARFRHEATDILHKVLHSSPWTLSRGKSPPPPKSSEAVASIGTAAVKSSIPSAPNQHPFLPHPSHFDLAPSPLRSRGIVVVAMYGFDADGDDELTVKEGEKLTVVDKEESDERWKCRNSKGKEGVVPASYLEASVQIESVGEAEATRAEAARKEQEQAAAAAKAKRLADESRGKHAKHRN